MKRNRVKKDKPFALSSAVENISVQATDDDNTPITIDVEKAWEEMRSHLVVNDEPAQETGSTKRIYVNREGSESEPVEIEIYPGATALDILSRLNLQGYVLTTSALLNSEWPNADRFSFEEVVYDQVMAGAQLIALTAVEAADRYINKLVFGVADPSQEAQQQLRKMIEEELR
jgi:hypothetical protein